ncbi:MAG: DUF59 domain-containing protein [Deltaproteobacteria bacterium]|nr:DUF59 domain-containing protein [Deltaproteobacteria bacterium]
MNDIALSTTEPIYSALREVIDPEIGLDIVTLGLVYDVEIHGDSVDVTFSLTTRGCFMERVITDGIVSAVGARARRPGGGAEPGLGPALAPRPREAGVAVIRATDRLSTVLAHDERLIEVLAAAAPPLEGLRSPSLRKNMAPWVTVAQAAQIAGLDATVLVERLNRALGEQPPAPTARTQPAFTPTPVPAELLAVPPARLVDLDVRDDLRSGVEPLARIMSASRTLPPESILRIRAIRATRSTGCSPRRASRTSPSSSRSTTGGCGSSARRASAGPSG